MLGGTFTSDGQTWYYGSEHEAMLDAGTWTGGYVENFLLKIINMALKQLPQIKKLKYNYHYKRENAKS